MAEPNEEPVRTVDMPSITVVEAEEGDGIDDLPVAEEMGTPPPSLAPEPLFSFGVEVCHEFDEGMRFAPRAGAAGAANTAAWRAHAGICRCSVVWQASAVGQQPAAPNPDTGSANYVLEKKRFASADPKVTPGGGLLFTLMGRYDYILLKPPGPYDKLMAAACPLSDVPAASNGISFGDFDRTLLSSVAPEGFVPD